MDSDDADRATRRGIALLRAAKAAVALGLAAGAGIGHGQAAAARLAGWAELADGSAAPWQGALQAGAGFVGRHGLLLAGLLLLLAALHAVEAWALWRGLRWAALLVVLSVASMLPLEALAVWQHASPLRLGLLLGNTLLLLWLWRRVVRSLAAAPGAVAR